MGLIIKPTKENKIQIEGTELTLDKVYARINFLCDANGIHMRIGYQLFANKETSKQGKVVHTSIPVVSFNATLEDGETQTLDTALKLAKQGIEKIGYNAEIEKD